MFVPFSNALSYFFPCLSHYQINYRKLSPCLSHYQMIVNYSHVCPIVKLIIVNYPHVCPIFNCVIVIFPHACPIIKSIIVNYPHVWPIIKSIVVNYPHVWISLMTFPWNCSFFTWSWSLLRSSLSDFWHVHSAICGVIRSRHMSLIVTTILQMH